MNADNWMECAWMDCDGLFDAVVTYRTVPDRVGAVWRFIFRGRTIVVTPYPNRRAAVLDWIPTRIEPVLAGAGGCGRLACAVQCVLNPGADLQRAHFDYEQERELQTRIEKKEQEHLWGNTEDEELNRATSWIKQFNKKRTKIISDFVDWKRRNPLPERSADRRGIPYGYRMGADDRLEEDPVEKEALKKRKEQSRQMFHGLDAETEELERMLQLIRSKMGGAWASDLEETIRHEIYGLDGTNAKQRKLAALEKHAPLILERALAHLGVKITGGALQDLCNFIRDLPLGEAGKLHMERMERRNQAKEVMEGFREIQRAASLTGDQDMRSILAKIRDLTGEEIIERVFNDYSPEMPAFLDLWTKDTMDSQGITQAAARCRVLERVRYVAVFGDGNLCPVQAVRLSPHDAEDRRLFREMEPEEALAPEIRVRLDAARSEAAIMRISHGGERAVRKTKAENGPLSDGWVRQSDKKRIAGNCRNVVTARKLAEMYGYDPRSRDFDTLRAGKKSKGLVCYRSDDPLNKRRPHYWVDDEEIEDAAKRGIR